MLLLDLLIVLVHSKIIYYQEMECTNYLTGLVFYSLSDVYKYGTLIAL